MRTELSSLNLGNKFYLETKSQTTESSVSFHPNAWENDLLHLLPYLANVDWAAITYQALPQALGIDTAMNGTNKKLMVGAEKPEK